MPDPAMQPEYSDEKKKGLDVSSMSANFTFNNDTNHTVNVTVDITGTGTDTASFNLYGASNTPSPSSSNGNRLQGPLTSRPLRMAGSGTWTAGESYTAEVAYTRANTVVKWKYTVPASSLGAGAHTYNNNSMTKEP